ncbi:hypothetical protein Ahy_A02g007007 [Arachis hypogaea]|uniref:CCHC-type domain-containing protein n=1 Tax=Arachis hypogaea TaxID=3818 RepID=A0A445EBJ1_ARAHY|nr:hypothetical protein Ahy_A02g007007 [Arachis hypogaea]
MDDRISLKLYYFGQILLQTSKGVKFSCENPLDIVIPFTISFEELKGVIYEKIDSEMSKKISCILYKYPIPIFGGFVQFQTKYVTDEASMQEMFSMYIETHAHISVIELYIEFEQSEANRNIEQEDYNSDSDEEFESNYEVVAPDGDEDQGDGAMAPNVADVANALANEHPFEEPSFMRILDLEAMHAPEFSKYMSADGEFAVGMKFSFREAVIIGMKVYSIRRDVDYRVYESEPLKFYAKLIALTSRTRSLKCVRCQVEQSMPSTSVDNGVTMRLDWRVYVHDIYKMDQLRRVYRVRFRPLGNLTTWPAYYGPRFVPNMYLRRVNFLNEMDTRMLRGPRRCRQCGVEGHSCSRCRRSAGAGPGNPAQ